MNSSFKNIYNFIISFQLIALLIFFIFLFQSGGVLVIPIRIYLHPLAQLNFDFEFTYASILAFMSVMGTLYILAGVQVAASGMNETSTKSIKGFIVFLSKFVILLTPLTYIFSQSSVLNIYIVPLSVVLFVIHMFNFLDKSEVEGSEK